jgi:uncharacterized membrane protein
MLSQMVVFVHSTFVLAARMELIMYKKTRYIAISAMIAAIYVALTLSLSFISYGPIQFRISEALTILPYFTPAAIPGLFVGCFISNLLGSPFGFVDIIIGSLATLLAAILSRKMPKKYFVPLPPIVVNAIFVGTELYYGAKLLNFNQAIVGDLVKYGLLPAILMVGFGELVVCYLLGYPLLLLLDKYKHKIF